MNEISATVGIPITSIGSRRAAARPGARWSVDQVEALFALPFNDLIHRAQRVHREYFDPNEGSCRHCC